MDARRRTASRSTLRASAGRPDYVAVDPVNHKIYATNGHPDGRLFVLGKPVTLPKATIQPVTNLTDNSATLHGLVNPEGSPFSTG